MRYGLASVVALLLAGPAMADPVSGWAELQSAIAKASEVPDADFEIGRRQSYAKFTLAMFEAANAVDRRYASYLKLPAATAAASAEAAVDAAAHDTLIALYPGQKEMVEDAYVLALAAVPPGPARDAGIVVGQAAAAAALAAGGTDPAALRGRYLPAGKPGQFVLVGIPFDPAMVTMRPWVIARADALRAPPPPALTSPEFTRAFDEVKRLGAKGSTERTPVQTLRSKFWSDYDIDPVLRQISDQRGRSLVRNARMYAMVAVADDDDLLVMVDGKSFYQYWRPLSAIRNADADGNPATSADPDWQPLLKTPGQPEYPCGHCSFATVLGTLLAAEGPPPPGGYRFTSDKYPGVTMAVPTMADFSEQVSVARIHGGVHFRSTMDATLPPARKLAEMVMARFAPLR